MTVETFATFAAFTCAWPRVVGPLDVVKSFALPSVHGHTSTIDRPVATETLARVVRAVVETLHHLIKPHIRDGQTPFMGFYFLPSGL